MSEPTSEHEQTLDTLDICADIAVEALGATRAALAAGDEEEARRCARRAMSTQEYSVSRLKAIVLELNRSLGNVG